MEHEPPVPWVPLILGCPHDHVPDCARHGMRRPFELGDGAAVLPLTRELVPNALLAEVLARQPHCGDKLTHKEGP
eukprot:2771426-Heterocapsa_arctica.AAC.1